MKKMGFVLCLMLLLGLSASIASATTLVEYAFNLDGSVSDNPYGSSFPGNVNLSGFAGGFGDITITISGAGNHHVLSFFDYEIDADWYSFDQAAIAGTLSSSPGTQSYEIGDPYYDNIYNNFENNGLANATSPFEGDVSMSIGYNFYLAANQSALVTYHLSESMMTTPFYITQSSLLTDDPYNITGKVYFGSALEIITNPKDNVVPEPSTLLLVFTGCGLAIIARFRKSS